MPHEIVLTHSNLGAIANEIHNSSVVGVDTETTSLSPYDGRIRLVSLNTGSHVYVIDLFQTGGLGPVADALGNPKTIKVLQNAKFDQKFFLKEFRTELFPVFDTFRASFMLHNGEQEDGEEKKHDLYAIYDRELGLPPSLDLGGSDWSGSLTPEQYGYSADDVLHLHELRDTLRAQVIKKGLGKACAIEFGAILPEAAIELAGFRLDRAKWMALARQHAEEAHQLKEQLLYELPHPKNQMSLPGMTAQFNLGSHQQLLQSVARLGIKCDDTKEDTLALFAAKFPVIQKLIRWKKVSKLCSSFGEDYPDQHIRHDTGRVHCQYWPLTGAGRYSCAKPNLQQIPRDKRFRACFAVGPGRKLVIADYSQIELRVAAQITGDKTLLEIYRNGLDAHARTGSLVTGVPLAQVTKDQRQIAKAINFGLIFGMMPEKLVIYAQANYGVSMSLAQAKKFRERYFEAYSGVAAWHPRVLRDGKRTGESRTLSGRIRYLDPTTSYNEFMNTPVQGSAADGLKASLAILYRKLKQYGKTATMVHMVHDEILVECDDDPGLCQAVKQDLEDAMVAGMMPLLPDVPVVVEAGFGDSWASK